MNFPQWSGLSPNDVISILGLMVTTIAFCVGCYFILLATSAHSHLKNIEEVFQASKAIQNKIALAQNECVHVCSDSVCILHDLYTDRIAYNVKMRNENQGNPEELRKINTESIYAYRERARLAIKYRNWDVNKRVNRLRELFKFGEEDDWKEIRRLANESKGEPLEIVTEARALIKRRYQMPG